MFSCQILHTVRAGEVPIYSVYFTKTKIVFLSSDGKIQHWLWESTDEHGKDGYKYHTVTEGDTIKAICKIYQVNVRQLLKLNPDTDIRLVKVGTRLLISKPKSKNDDLKRNVRFGTRSKFRNTAAINSFEDIVPPEDDILRPNILAERTSLASRLVK